MIYMPDRDAVAFIIALIKDILKITTNKWNMRLILPIIGINNGINICDTSGNFVIYNYSDPLPFRL